MKDPAAKYIIRALEELMTSWGRPESIRVDNATYCVGGQLEEWLSSKHIALNKALKYTPQSNGLAERAVGTLKSFFRANHNDTKWDEYMEEALYYSNLTNVERQNKKKQDKITDKCQVGDYVWTRLDSKKSTKPFKDLITKKDKVIKIVDDHMVELLENGHYGVRVQCDNKRLGRYYPIPIVRMRYKKDESIIIWTIPKEIPEYYKREDVPKPEYKMTWNYTGELNDEEKLFNLKRFWMVRHFDASKPVLLAGWEYCHQTMDSTIRRNDINQGINRLLSEPIETNMFIYANTSVEYSLQEQGRCMPPFPYYFLVARKQHYKEVRDPEKIRSIEGEIKRKWSWISNESTKNFLLIAGMGMGTYKTLKWIINNFHIILIVTTIMFLLIIVELTGIGRILRMILSKIYKLVRKCREGVKKTSGSDLYTVRPSPERVSVVRPYKLTYV